MPGQPTTKVDSKSPGRGNKNNNNLYKFDSDHIELLEAEKPWDKNVKHFTHTKLSAVAAMKMLKHALSGVKKAKITGGKPLEVMGLMIGKPEGNTIIIMDCFPLPVEGSETKVVADDEDVQAYMINMSESLEQTRKERFIGWYHSHPFDVSTDSHCFLSSTDVTTQLMWQRVLDPKWVAIVVDPLRSLAKLEPQFGCYRCYPPNHSPPSSECPDGTLVPDERNRISRWGKAFNRYYSMEISYFMSSLGSQLLDIMSYNHLWIRVLGSTSIMEQENRQRFAERVRTNTKKLDAGESHFRSSHSQKPQMTSASSEQLGVADQALCELSIEQCQGHSAQIAKNMLFNRI